MDIIQQHHMINMDFVEFQTNNHSRHSSLSSIADDCSWGPYDIDDFQSCPSCELLDDDDDDSLNMLTILASNSFEIRMLYESRALEASNSFEIPSQITTTTNSPRKRTISQHDETASTFLSSSSSCGEGLQSRQRLNSDNNEWMKSERSLSPLEDMVPLLESLSILDSSSSEQLKSPRHRRISCDLLPTPEELAKLSDEKSHRRNRHVVLIPMDSH